MRDNVHWNKGNLLNLLPEKQNLPSPRPQLQLLSTAELHCSHCKEHRNWIPLKKLLYPNSPQKESKTEVKKHKHWTRIIAIFKTAPSCCNRIPAAPVSCFFAGGQLLLKGKWPGYLHNFSWKKILKQHILICFHLIDEIDDHVNWWYLPH